MPDRLSAALQDLADRPARLLALLFLANAVGLPYAGLIHDSRLYAAQALNARPPARWVRLVWAPLPPLPPPRRPSAPQSTGAGAGRRR